MKLDEFKNELLKIIGPKDNLSAILAVAQEQRKLIIEALQHGLGIDEIVNYPAEKLPQLVKLKVRDNVSEIEG